MDTDASQQQDAAVQVGVKQETYQFAEQLSERPCVLQEVVDDEQGQREEVEEVGHGQVHQVDGGAGPVGAAAAEPQHDSVEEQPQHEDGAVSKG